MENNLILHGKELFETIKANFQSKYQNSKSFFFTYIENHDHSDLTIKIRLKKNTDIHSYPCDINFHILIDYLFPASTPKLKCMTNFCIPTLFDDRDLLTSVIHKTWNNDIKIEEIVEMLPNFISRVSENSVNSTLVYFGEYDLDKVYDINEFLMNNELSFFKVKQKLFKENKLYHKDRYLVLTDIYIILFDEFPNSKNFARMIFQGDIRQVKKSSGSDSDSMQLEWLNSDEKNSIKLEILMDKNRISLFLEKLNKKVNQLKDFIIFHEDHVKPFNVDDELEYNYKNINYIVSVLQLKESLYNLKATTNLKIEILALLHKIISIYSSMNDPHFQIYVEKLHIFEKEDKISVETSQNYEDFTKKLSTRALRYRESQTTFSIFNAEEIEK